MATESKDAEYGPSDTLRVVDGNFVASTERGVAGIISVSPSGEYVIYTNGTVVVVRSVADPTKAFVYAEHTAPVLVAKFSPSGNYVASGDATGKVRVWAWNHPDHVLKNEAMALGGPVQDLAWGPESKRICAVGGGASKAKLFMFDTGSNLGEVVPLSKKATTCAMKPCRPYRAVWGGEDFELQFYSGPPFRYTCGLKEHKNFVNCVRYAPDGSKFVSVSSDKTCIVYDGKTAEIIGRLDAASMHTGSVYHCAWSPDGARLVTSGADKTLRIWDMASYALIKSIVVGTAVNDMQNSVAWSPTGIISLSLSGELKYFDPDGSDAPTRVVAGHRQPVTAFDFDRETGRLYTIDGDGRVCAWHPTTEAGDCFEAMELTTEPHTKRGVAVSVAGGKLSTTSWDQKIRIASATSGECETTVAVGGQPRGMSVAADVPNLRVVVTVDAIRVFLDDSLASETPVPFAPTCVSVAPNGSVVAVGAEDKRVHLFTVDAAAGSLTPAGESPELAGAASCVAVSPDSTLVAAGDTSREVWVFDCDKMSRVNPARWQSHATRVVAIAWRPSGSHLVSVSTDRRLCIWDPAAPSAARKVDLASPTPFTGVAWQNEEYFWASSSDGVLRRHKADV